MGEPKRKARFEIGVLKIGLILTSLIVKRRNIRIIQE